MGKIEKTANFMVICLYFPQMISVRGGIICFCLKLSKNNSHIEGLEESISFTKVIASISNLGQIWNP